MTGHLGCKHLLQQLAITPDAQQNYTLVEGLLRFKGRIVIGEDDQLKLQILKATHGSAVGGHSGIRATYYRVRQLFYWPGLKKTVVKYVLEL